MDIMDTQDETQKAADTTFAHIEMVGRLARPLLRYSQHGRPNFSFGLAYRPQLADRNIVVPDAQWFDGWAFDDLAAQLSERCVKGQLVKLSADLTYRQQKLTSGGSRRLIKLIAYDMQPAVSSDRNGITLQGVIREQQVTNNAAGDFARLNITLVQFVVSPNGKRFTVNHRFAMWDEAGRHAAAQCAVGDLIRVYGSFSLTTYTSKQQVSGNEGLDIVGHKVYNLKNQQLFSYAFDAPAEDDELDPTPPPAAEAKKTTTPAPLPAPLPPPPTMPAPYRPTYPRSGPRYPAAAARR